MTLNHIFSADAPAHQFSGRIRILPEPDVQIIDCAVDPTTLNITSRPADDLVTVWNIRGGHAAADGLPEPAGDWLVEPVLVLTSQWSASLQLMDQVRVTALALPGATVRAYGVPTETKASGLLSRRSPVVQALCQVLSLIVDSPALEPLPGYALNRVLEELVSSALLEREGVFDHAAKPRYALFDRAMALIVQRRTDQRLDTSSIAHALGTSVRALQRAFHDRQTSVLNEIRAQRVDEASRLLGDSTFDQLTLSEIAAYSGFGSMDSMRRAFAAAGRQSPGSERAQS